MIREPASKNYVDNIFKIYIVLNDVNLEKIKFVKVNYQPASVVEHLTRKVYVDNAIDELSLVRSFQENDCNIHNLTNINSNTLKTEANNDNQVIAKSNVD